MTPFQIVLIFLIFPLICSVIAFGMAFLSKPKKKKTRSPSPTGNRMQSISAQSNSSTGNGNSSSSSSSNVPSTSKRPLPSCSYSSTTPKSTPTPSTSSANIEAGSSTEDASSGLVSTLVGQVLALLNQYGPAIGLQVVTRLLTHFTANPVVENPEKEEDGSTKSTDESESEAEPPPQKRKKRAKEVIPQFRRHFPEMLAPGEELSEEQYFAECEHLRQFSHERGKYRPSWWSSSLSSTSYGLEGVTWQFAPPLNAGPWVDKLMRRVLKNENYAREKNRKPVHDDLENHWPLLVAVRLDKGTENVFDKIRRLWCHYKPEGNQKSAHEHYHKIFGFNGGKLPKLFEPLTANEKKEAYPRYRPTVEMHAFALNMHTWQANHPVADPRRPFTPRQIRDKMLGVEARLIASWAHQNVAKLLPELPPPGTPPSRPYEPSELPDELVRKLMACFPSSPHIHRLLQCKDFLEDCYQATVTFIRSHTPSLIAMNALSEVYSFCEEPHDKAPSPEEERARNQNAEWCHPLQLLLSAIYCGLAEDGRDAVYRKTSHSRSIKDHNCHDFKSNQSLYRLMAKAVNGGRPIRHLTILNKLSRESAALAELVVITFLNQLPGQSELNHQRGSAMMAGPIAAALTKEVKQVFGAALLIRTWLHRGGDAHVIASPDTSPAPGTLREAQYRVPLFSGC